MPKYQSINQIHQAEILPNFRNLGVTLRIVLFVNGMALMSAFAQADSWSDIMPRMADISALLQPALLADLLMLFAINPQFARISYRQGVISVVFLTATVTLSLTLLGSSLVAPLMEHAYFHSLRNALLGGAMTLLILVYFQLRTQALSPALQAARLLALQARIRPHFLFNSINAVLGIVRADPKRAETALEDMSDLFRMAMATSQDLVSVEHEVALARQYLALEQLRLGERLKVVWHLQDMPTDALLPPLILQPLLENAVYHGIEPLSEGGLIDIRLYRNGNQMHLEMYNPRLRQGIRHVGNKMALSNIRERLALQFDIEAHYTVESGDDFYHVHIMLPYVKEEKQ